MNILFVNMPIRVQAKPNIVPTGIGILASIAESKGHNCRVLDLNIYRPSLSEANIKKQLENFCLDFDIIGLSGLITTLRWQKKLAMITRKLFPGALIVSGGGLASDIGAALFEWIPELDLVVRGEGEEIFQTILTDHLKLKNSKKVIGPQIIADLDMVPRVSWDHFKMDTYLSNPVWGTGAGNSSWTPFHSQKSINLISSRGCPYDCNFCSRATTGGRNYRLASSDRLIRDINEVIEKFAVDFIGFVDDNFLSNKSRLEMFLPAIEKTGVKWGCHGRLNEVDEKTAAALAASGCIYIGFGGESADPGMLARMNKKNNPAQMSETIKNCQKFQIVPNCTWIMGYPGETRESVRKTAEFIMEHGLSQKNMFIATAYPGTALFNDVKTKILEVYTSMEEYVLALDDASKVLEHKGQVLNYSNMTEQEFIECRYFIEQGQLEKI
jgi:radical SAM superfamily enzyme YgiQ (UPF0313 family)